MRWPWQRPVEHRSSLTDQVVTAMLASASGGGTRPASATAALESAATLYASALSSCSISGPSVVTRALDATWRAAAAASLIRTGQTVFIIAADPVDGLLLEPVGHWDVYGGPNPASWYYRVERAGPSGTAWATHPAGSVLHLRWQTDPARPWSGVSPVQHASDTASLSGWLERRLSEEASASSGSFLPVAKFEPADGADLTDDDQADDPLGQLRADIGNAAGQTLLVESQMSLADSPASPRHAGIIKSPDSARILHAILSSCVSRLHATWARRAGSRERYSTRQHRDKRRAKVGGNLSRHRCPDCVGRIEAQVLDQLGVAVVFDTTSLGGVDILARASPRRGD